MEDQIHLIKEKINHRIGARDSIEERRFTLSNEVEELDESITATEKAMWLLQQYSESQQKVISDQIESVVTKGLQAVFQNPTMEFKLIYSQTKKGDKKKTPEVKMAIHYEYNGEMVEGNLTSSFGGGLSVVASVLLRVVVVLLLKDRVSPIIILDEPLRDLSPSYANNDSADNYRERMADFLRKLVDETSTQLIFVSHETDYSIVADVTHKFRGTVGETSKVETVYREEEYADNHM